MLDRVAERWDELAEVHARALGLPTDEVHAYCEHACGEDAELLALLLSLVDGQDDIDDRLKEAISTIADDAKQPESLVGAVVGAYQVDREIGHGGMGTVYLASRADGEFEKLVAVKVMRGMWSGDAMSALFRNERQVLANLNHPSIPSLVDSGQLDDGRSYFICDYIDGSGLDEYCEDAASDLNARLDLLLAVGSAVQYAHNNLVLHLDIKPSNILVDSNGSPSLLDFGVARLIGQLDSDHRAFSPGYASPEQIKGEAVSAASDVYSLGALLFFLLTGNGPFVLDKQAPTETVLLKRAEFLQWLEHQREASDVDPNLRAIVRKAMEDDPSNRYATVDAMHRDIERFRNHYPVEARPTSLLQRGSKFLRRNLLPATVTAAIVVTLSGFGVRENQLRQAAQSAERTAITMSDFFASIFEAVNPSQTRSSTLTARELLDNAVERIPIELADQPDVAGRVLHATSNTYAALGLYDQATSMMEEALALGRERADGLFTRDREAQLLTALGRQYANAGRLLEAKALLEENVRAIERDLGDNSKEYVFALSTLASVLTRLEDLAGAERLHERTAAVANIVFGPDAPEITSVLYDQDLYYQAVGDMAPREALLQRIVALEGSAYGAEHLKVAQAVSGLGVFYLEGGRLEKALPTNQRALALALQTLRPEHPEIALYKQRLGVTLRNMGRLDPAEVYVRDALRIKQETLGVNHPEVGATHSILGSLYNTMHRRTESLTHLHRALDIMRIHHSENHREVGYQKMALGEVYRVTGNLEEAERYTLDSITTLRSLGTQIDLALDGEWQLANIYRDQGRYVEALPIFERLFAWHHANPSLDDEHMLEVTEDFRALLRQLGQSARAETLLVPIKNRPPHPR